MKKIYFIIISVFLLIIVELLYNWNFKGVNNNHAVSLHDCIYASKYHQKVNILSMNNNFEIAYIENSNINCINPYFPSIHINTKEYHNAWLHLVYTDSKDHRLKVFIDSDINYYPFYSLAKDFFDAPLWSYSLLKKPLSFWEGHAGIANSI